MTIFVIEKTSLQLCYYHDVVSVDEEEDFFKVNLIDGTFREFAFAEFGWERVEEKQDSDDVRSYNVGGSDYSKHKFQVWDIWNEYHLNPFDADIIKRILRHKKGDTRKMDYEKVIHICKERIRQIDSGEDVWGE